MMLYIVFWRQHHFRQKGRIVCGHKKALSCRAPFIVEMQIIGVCAKYKLMKGTRIRIVHQRGGGARERILSCIHQMAQRFRVMCTPNRFYCVYMGKCR